MELAQNIQAVRAKIAQAAADAGRTPGEITLFDIYTAIDPELMIIECMDPQYHCVRDNRDKTPCLVHRELVEIQKELWKLFQRKTLQELFDSM